MDDATIRETLQAAAAPFATAQSAPSPSGIDLVYGPLFVALAPEVDSGLYPLALEFVYEGYLSHYRVGRLLAPDTSLATRLLAGDHFDAIGLRLVARAGDLDAVKLLTRLMASCSWLRAEGQPFACDDDLWALCVAGIASSASGGNALAALRAFDEVGRLFERDRVERLPDVVRRAATTLWLRDAAPLHAALGLAGPPEVASPPGVVAALDVATSDAAAPAAPAVPVAPVAPVAPEPDARIETEAAL
jgi:hypothetical protein